MHIISWFAGLWMALLSVVGLGSVQPPRLEVPQSAPAAQETPAPAQSAERASTPAADTSAARPSAAQSGAAFGVATHGTLDLTALPLGDGKVSSAPKQGYVYSCEQSFGGGGAQHAGDWIHGSTWNLSQKIQVEGEVYWSNATFSSIVSGTVRRLLGNGLPVGEPTGIFPIKTSDPAYQIDRNPNAVAASAVNYALPADPSFAAEPSCVPMGAIGYALDGVAIYNALDAAGRDAVAHEVQDSCDGHPQGAGQYHYHGPSPCMPKVDERNRVVGYALDGFAITSLYDANGALYTNADLDLCHGMTSAYTDADGKTQTGYHYVLTEEYPYTLGCFRGTPVAVRPPRR